jgi:hypothetical protein
MFNCSICDESFEHLCLWKRHNITRRHRLKITLRYGEYNISTIKKNQKIFKQEVIKNIELNNTMKDKKKEERINKIKDKIKKIEDETKIKLDKLQEQLEKLL